MHGTFGFADFKPSINRFILFPYVVMSSDFTLNALYGLHRNSIGDARQFADNKGDTFL